MGPLQAIWLTHHHPDHAGGAAWLSEHAELPIWAHATTASLLEKHLRVDRVFAHGDSIPLPTGENSKWTAVHTPGHAAGHLCLFHEPTRRLIAGDMMAGVGTILVDPADGDMATYIQSLENLAAMNPSAAVPAHGPILCEATAMLKFYVGHRLFREQKIYDTISENAEAMYEVLLRAYDDAPPEVLPIAALSLESHVRKLEQEGRVARNAQGLVARC
jgi:glyoxylase-like metal-dependent hydrolase (beta-lactamase superfamily II)